MNGYKGWRYPCDEEKSPCLRECTNEGFARGCGFQALLRGVRESCDDAALQVREERQIDYPQRKSIIGENYA